MKLKKFSSINLNDTFFDSLKSDYSEFSEWFAKKSKLGEEAFVQYDNDNENDKLLGFLFLKDESQEIDNKITPLMETKKRLKVGTFKIVPHNTRLGEKFIKKIMDYAVYGGYEEVYVTIYPKHECLINLLTKNGFKHYGEKLKE